MKKNSETNEESIRLAIQAGIVASCLAVISGDYGSLGSNFQIFTKLLALAMSILSMSYIMLTARKYGFKNRQDISWRKWLYDKTISFYWLIFGMMIYLFTSSYITYSTGIDPIILYIITLAVVCLLAFSLKVVEILIIDKKRK